MKTTNKLKLISFAVMATFIGFFGLPAFAENEACSIDSTNPACQGGGSIFNTFDSVMGVVLAVVGVIATIVIIIAGVMIATSQGDAGKVKKARSAIIYAAVGMVVALAAWAIVNFVVGSV